MIAAAARGFVLGNASGCFEGGWTGRQRTWADGGMRCGGECTSRLCGQCDQLRSKCLFLGTPVEDDGRWGGKFSRCPCIRLGIRRDGDRNRRGYDGRFRFKMPYILLHYTMDRSIVEKTSRSIPARSPRSSSLRPSAVLFPGRLVVALEHGNALWRLQESIALVECQRVVKGYFC